MRDRACQLIRLHPTEQPEVIDVYHGTPLWRASLEWARFFDIDPMRVPAESEIIADVAMCQIRYERTILDEKGRPRLDRFGDLLTELVTEQLEAPPLPFPKGPA